MWKNMDTDDSGNNDSAELGNMSLENILVTMNKGVLKKNTVIRVC